MFVHRLLRAESGALTCRPCFSHSVCEVQRAVGTVCCCFAYRAQDDSFNPCQPAGGYGGDPAGQEISRSRVFLLVTLGKRMGLAIDKVIHHDNVILAVIIRAWGGVPCGDPHVGDPGIVKYNAEE